MTTTAAVLVLVGISEWVTYRQTAGFLTAHEAMMRQGPDGAALLTLPAGKQLLLLRLTGLRLLNAAISMVALMVVLNFLWLRFIASPMRALLRHIDWMSRGTWKTPISVRQKDEMGDLTRAFNELGERLTLTVQQFTAASKLSALALIGQRIVRKTETAKSRILEVKGVLAQAVHCGSVVPCEVLPALNEAVEILNTIQVQLEAEFYEQLRACGMAPGSDSARQQASVAGPGSEGVVQLS